MPNIKPISELRNYGNVLMVKDADIALICEIRHCIDNLQSFPAVGPRLDIPSEVQYRHLLCGNYVVIYRLESEYTYIEKIAYKREDYIKLFIFFTAVERLFF